MKNRIWTDGEGLTWSTITELLGEDEDTGSRIADLVLDLYDNVKEKQDRMEELKIQIDQLRLEIDFIHDNFGSCMIFESKRFGNEGIIRVFHDKEPIIVSVEKKGDSIDVSTQDLMVHHLNSKSNK